MLPKIMNTWQVAAHRPDRGLTEERADRAAEAAATVAAIAMPQQWAVWSDGESPLPAKIEVIDFSGGVGRHGDQA